MIRQGILCTALLLRVLCAGGQTPAYPQDYFANPLGGPWNTVLLAGNFGECRPGHFHSGLDMKTDGVENKPVRAAAAGYVSRISMKPGGFGHALYVTHPNGYTTLYAHLNDFRPDLQAFVRAAQYAAESWTLDTVLPAGKFPVAQNDLIAYSGNTGGSTAPHLHFEIRNTATERPLNPQLFGCTVKDSRPPVIYAVSLYEAESSIYDTPPISVKAKGAAGAFRADTLRPLTRKVGIGITTDDFMDGSDNTMAFYKAELYLDGALQQTISLDDIGYDETRYLNAYADYRTKHNGGPWVQLLYRLPGNNLKRIYSEERGILQLSGAPQQLRIVLQDNNGNTSTFEAPIRGGAPAAAMACRRNSTIETPSIRYAVPAAALYDDVCFGEPVARRVPGALSPALAAGRADVPLHASISLSLRADKAIPFAQRNRIALVRRDGKTEDGRAATPEAGGWYKAAVREFGEYRLVADVQGPAIHPVGGPKLWRREIRFTVTDAITGVRSFRGELDGRWILFEQHGNSWFYRADDRLTPGRHTLLVTATDDCGNTTKQRYSFAQ